MPTDSSEIWQKCDILITANPNLLDMKPEGKVSVKIDKEYNGETNSDFNFSSMRKFVEDEENTEKIIEYFEKNGTR